MSSIRVSKETQERLKLLSKRKNMSYEIILSYMLDQMEKVNFFDEDWMDQVAEERLQHILSDADIEFRKSIEKDKHKAILKAKQRVFDEYLKILPTSEKRPFLENILGDINSGNLLENMSNYEMVIIDGYKRLCLFDKNGFPRLAGTPPAMLEECSRGFHTKNQVCNCYLWNECPSGKPQYENWLGQYGTEAQQLAYLEETTGQKYFMRRNPR
jgi:hypothetical protein